MRQLAGGIALVLLLAACGGDDDVAGDPTPTSRPDTTVPGATAGGDSAGNDSSPVSEAPGAQDEPSTGVPDEAPEAAEDSEATVPREATPEDANLPERVPTSTEAPVTGEVVGSVLSSIKADLATRTGADESEMVLIRAEEVIWNDGSLGCPVPGEFYTQAQVSGYWVVIEHGGSQYDYRANDKGFFRLCEGGSLPPTNPSG